MEEHLYIPHDLCSHRIITAVHCEHIKHMCWNQRILLQNQNTGEVAENALDQGASEILMNDHITSDACFIMKESVIMFHSNCI